MMRSDDLPVSATNSTPKSTRVVDVEISPFP
jgi:hypothetical protein